MQECLFLIFVFLLMTNFDWTQFHKRIYIKKPVTGVFNPWGIPRQIITWYFKSAPYVSTGGVASKEEESFMAGDSYIWIYHQKLEMTR